jgi:hypothetical protein
VLIFDAGVLGVLDVHFPNAGKHPLPQWSTVVPHHPYWEQHSLVPQTAPLNKDPQRLSVRTVAAAGRGEAMTVEIVNANANGTHIEDLITTEG